MLNPSQHSGGQQSVVIRSVQGIATCTSLIAALLAAPRLNGLMGEAVGNMAAASYGESVGSFVQFAFYLTLFPAVFFTTRAVLSAAILLSVTKLATRYL